MADAMSAAQCALHCNEIPQRYSSRGSPRPKCAWTSVPHRGRVRLGGTRACATAVRQRRPRGLVSLEDVCAVGCAVQEGGRAGSEEGELGEHAAIAEERAVLCAMLPCCPDSHARHEQRGCGQTLVFRHTVRRRLGRAVCGGVGSRGRWSRVRRSRERCGCRLRCSSVGNVRWWGVAMAVGSAPERGDGGEGAPSAPRCIDALRSGCCPSSPICNLVSHCFNLASKRPSRRRRRGADSTSGLRPDTTRKCHSFASAL